MPTSSIPRRVLIALIVVLGGLVAATPAAATPPPGYDESAPPAADPNPPGPTTEATIVDMIHTSGLFGGTVPAAVAQTPYPSSGLQDLRTVETAQLILDDPATPTPEEIPTYCIDLATQTTIGIHYELGDWTEANVPNLPYVQWILENHYPNDAAAPSGTPAEKVRAVQGAIWYFTDRFVVAPAYASERAAVQQIVEAAQAALAGPVPPAPSRPTLTVTPATLDGLADGQIVGPFTVGGNVTDAAITISASTSVFRDSLGTLPVVDGDRFDSGDQLWIEYDPGVEDQRFTLAAQEQIEVGNVFLYDGHNPPLTEAQKLVLAAQAFVTVQASASVVPEEAGALQVEAFIAGPAAGSQGRITLEAECVQSAVGWRRASVFEVPAGRTEPAVFSQAGIPEGAVCAVTQTADGATPRVRLAGSVLAPPDGAVAITSGATSRIEITDTYAFAPGSVNVVVSVGGDAAGLQGAIEVRVDCTLGAATASGSFTVPAAAAGTSLAGTLTGVAPGSVCVARQTASGADADAVLVSSAISPASVVVAGGDVATITVTNAYAAPAPVPTPTATASGLPLTGGAEPAPWWLAGVVAVVAGAGLTIASAVGRRAR